MRIRAVQLLRAALLLVLSGGVFLAPAAALKVDEMQSENNVSLAGTVDVSKLPSLNGEIVSNWDAPSRGRPGSRFTHPAQAGGSISSASSFSSSVISASDGFDGIVEYESCFCIPPDVQVAAGPSHLVEMVNLAGRVFTKTGIIVRSFSLSSFFLTSTDFISDPKVLYDVPSGRWFATILRCGGTNCSATTADSTMVAVSASSDPNGLWTIYTVPSGTGQLPDQPLIGISDDKFVISANIFTSSYVGARWWVLNKDDLVAGVPSPASESFGPFSSQESVYPVQSLSSTTTQYMVTVGASDIGTTSNTVGLFSITGTPGISNVQVTNLTITVQPITDPPNAVDPSGGLLSTVDRRVQSAAWQQGRAWLGLNNACVVDTTRSCVRLIEIDTTAQTLRQDIDYGASGQYFFFPALSIDSQGSLLFVYGFSSPSIYPSLAVSGQRTSDPLGSLAAPKTIKQGTASGAVAFLRNGDYYGAATDPSDSTLIWIAGEYHTTITQTCGPFGDSCWSTFIDNTSFLDFTVSTNPTSLTFDPGTSANTTVTITSLNGFAGTVNITAASSSPALTASCSPSSVTLGASASSVCTFTSSISGQYTITVKGASGPRVHSTTVNVTVRGFTISSSKSPIFVQGGSSTTATLTVTSVGGFSGNVTLSTSISPSLPGGPTTTLNPTSVVVSPGQPRTSTLTVSTTSSTPKGVYTLSTNGTSGMFFFTLAISLAVTPATVSINNTTTFTGVTVSTTGTLTVDSPASSITVSGTPSIVATNSSTGATLFSRTYTISKQPPGKFLLPIYVSPYALSSKVSFTVTAGSSSSSVQVTRDMDVNDNGLVDMPDLDIVGASFGCSLGNPCYDGRADINADGAVDIFDLATLGANFLTPSSIPSFLISASPATVIFPAFEGPRTSTITLTSINGFSGTVSLSHLVFRNGRLAQFSGLTVTLSQTSVTLSQGGTASVTATFNSSTNATYSAVVSGTSGQQSRSTTVTVKVTPCRRVCPV